MKKENVKIGMKVVPFQKTAFTQKLENSGVWIVARSNYQKFLYVIDWDDKLRCFVLNDENVNNGANGDFFNPEDFEPYDEIKEIKLPEWDLNIQDALYVLKSKGITPEVYEQLWKQLKF